MDDPQAPSEAPAASSSSGRLCSCACQFCCRPASPSWRRSLKRRLDPGGGGGGCSDGVPAVRVEVEDEVAALRETVEIQKETIQELCAELEEERSAAASAASETMSMILRLQREKAELQMEARQFKRFADEKMEHDLQELLDLEDLLFKREEAVQALTLQVQAYQHRLLSCGIDPGDADSAVPSDGASDDELRSPQFQEVSTFEHPPSNRSHPSEVEREGDYDDATAELEENAFAEMAHGEEALGNFEQQSCQLETSPAAADSLEKGVVEEPPRPSARFRSFSADSRASIPSMDSNESLQEDFPAPMDEPLDDGSGNDDMSDRVYTIDAVHGVSTVNVIDDWADALEEKEKRREADNEMECRSPDIKNLYMRLRALEADREAMRQAMISMRTEKAQFLLLGEIAQRLHKNVSPERRILKKTHSVSRFSILAVLKWIFSFILWRKKAPPTKYTFGLSKHNVGLLLLLDNSPRISNWRSATGTCR